MQFQVSKSCEYYIYRYLFYGVVQCQNISAQERSLPWHLAQFSFYACTISDLHWTVNYLFMRANDDY